MDKAELVRWVGHAVLNFFGFWLGARSKLPTWLALFYILFAAVMVVAAEQFVLRALGG